MVLTIMVVGELVLLWAGAVKLGCCPGSNMWCMVDKFSHGPCGPASSNRLHMYFVCVWPHKNTFLMFSGCIEWPGLPCFPLLVGVPALKLLMLVGITYIA